ncbi:Uncharacterised protein [Mycobacteroides abscessus subsp. abscessus]|nr:Uncharacterised protein [Mycobacteroides abscessus subsp. abscessus]SIG98790.1 Uncharacterised protein [Mycobacteroides abscessus subsp. abscessus]
MTSFSLVESDPRYMIDSDGTVYGPRRVLRPSKYTGYLVVSIGGKSRSVHRLVAEHFIPNPDNKSDVAHEDGNGLFSAASNLRWATTRENMSDRNRHGTDNRGGKHCCAKLTQEQVEYIRSMKGSYWGVQTDLARRFRVTDSTINTIMHGKHWKV